MSFKKKSNQKTKCQHSAAGSFFGRLRFADTWTDQETSAGDQFTYCPAFPLPSVPNSMVGADRMALPGDVFGKSQLITNEMFETDQPGGEGDGFKSSACFETAQTEL